jgi:hypothetical protein
VKPTVGRIVHYYIGCPSDPMIGPLPAIITKVDGDKADLYAIGLSLDRHDRYAAPYQGVNHSEQPKAFCWSWPPREDAK